MEVNLKISVEQAHTDSAYQLIVFEGEFDKAGYTAVKEDLNKAIEDFDLKYLIFDFRDLKFINSEGIGYLMEVHTHLVQRDRKLIIVGLNAHVKDVFHTIGMSEIIDSFDQLDEFLNSL